MWVLHFPGHYQGARLELGQPVLKLGPIWDARISGNCFTRSTTVLVLGLHVCNILKSSYWVYEHLPRLNLCSQ